MRVFIDLFFKGLLCLLLWATVCQAAPPLDPFARDSGLASHIDGRPHVLEAQASLFNSLLNIPIPSFSQTGALPKENRAEKEDCFWKERIAKVFLKLYPDYLPSDPFEKPTAISTPSTSKCGPSSLFLKTGTTPSFLQVSIVESLRPNAFSKIDASLNSELSTITIASSLLELLQSDAQLAFVLAHEMAHIVYEHFPPQFPIAILSPKQIAQIQTIRQEWEYVADFSALRDLSRAGFDPSPAVSLLRRLTHVLEESPVIEEETHPDPARRLAAFKFAQKEISVMPVVPSITSKRFGFTLH